MIKKYKLDDNDTINIDDKTLYRIVALIDFAGVSPGDKGGYIENEENLSQYGNAWVRDEACVYENAKVCDNALVYGKAKIYGNARISGNAKVYDNAYVSYNAEISDNAEAYDNAGIFDNARVFGKAFVYGGARIYENAKISGKAKVYDKAWVHGNAQVYDYANVYGQASVRDNAKVYNNAKIYNHAWVYGDAQVYEIASVFNRAEVSGKAHVFENAQVFGDAKISGESQVYGKASVSKNAKICDNAKIYDSARVLDNAQVYGSANIYGYAHISGEAKIYDNAKVYGHAMVFDRARVCGNAHVYHDTLIYNDANVYDRAEVFQDARVFGKACVCGDAKIYDDVEIFGDALISGKAQIASHEDYFCAQSFGLKGRPITSITFFKTIIGWAVSYDGFFLGTIERFRKKVKEIHGDSLIAQEHLLIADLMELRIKRIGQNVKNEEKIIKNNIQMNNKNKHKKHPRAELIKAWADGEQIQYRSHEDLWVDCDTMPNWDSGSEYRIKPEDTSNEPWKPKVGERYFYLEVINGTIRALGSTWNNDNVDFSLYRLHDLFHTEEEAKAAIPCVEDALKIALKGGDSLMSKKSCLLELEVKDAEIKTLKNDLEKLKLKISAPNRKNFQLDGKLLSDGEKALIRAMRNFKITQIGVDEKSAVIFVDETGNLQFNHSKIFLYSSETSVKEDDAVKEALNQIKKEQENNE